MGRRRSHVPARTPRPFSPLRSQRDRANMEAHPSTKMAQYIPPAFLTELLHARSPSGYEGEAQAVFDRHVKPAADEYRGDALGNRIATLNPDGDPTLMLAGHIDELGLIITYVNKDGFIYFDTIGGHDRTVISGPPGRHPDRERAGEGRDRQARHPPDGRGRPEEGPRDPRDLDRHRGPVQEGGARAGLDRRRRHLRPRIRADPRHASGRRGPSTTRSAPTSSARPSSAWRRRRRSPPQRSSRSPPPRRRSASAGATSSVYSVDPQVALVVDVGHATDHPDCDNRKYGETKLSGGPIICRGAEHQPQGLRRPGQGREEAEDPLPGRGRPAPDGHGRPGHPDGPRRRRDGGRQHPAALHAHAERGRGPGGRRALREALRRVRAGDPKGRLPQLVAFLETRFRPGPARRGIAPSAAAGMRQSLGKGP